MAGFTGVVLTDDESAFDGRRELQFVPEDGASTVWAVSCTWEGRRRFEAYGEPLAFEETERYERRLTRERLTSEMLERYCGQLGLRPYDPLFYEQTGYLVSDVRSEFQRALWP